LGRFGVALATGGIIMMRWIGLLAIGCAALFAPAVSAGGYPERPVTIVIGFAPGSGIDVIYRVIGHRLEAALKQSIVIENKVGANSAIAATYVARAAPDGYTLLAGTSGTHAANLYLFKSIAYDPAKDFAPISRTGSFAYMLVSHPQVPAKSAAELITYAKANPGELSFATSNSSGLISGLTFVRFAEISLNHVPYKTAPPAINDVLGGRVSLMFTDVTTALPHVNANLLRGLMVIASKRSALLPDLPSLQEVGLVDFDSPSWAAIYAPAKTPGEIIARLNTELRKIIDDPSIRAQFAAMGFEAASSTPEELADFAKNDRAKWAGLVKDAGIEPQ
jgi:tripartite-type tricarboxylate transporter receptor subunit TctC